jgi:hypothetical protein
MEDNMFGIVLKKRLLSRREEGGGRGGYFTVPVILSTFLSVAS